MSCNNVFSNNADTISILVHTESYLDDTSVLEWFVNANKLKGINVYFMPVLTTDVKVPVTTGTYVNITANGRVHTSIELDDFSGILYVHKYSNIELDDEIYFEETEKHVIKGDISFDMFNYIVFENKENINDKNGVPVLDFEECKAVLRLFLVHKKDFAITEHSHIDETFYYIYRHKQIFSEFQNFWSAVCNGNGLNDWADALDNRLWLMAICFDNCKIEALKHQNNVTVMQLKYHISYLLLLITGTLDNLAWLINNLYELKIEEDDRKKIDLIKKAFKNIVKNKSLKLFDFLDSDLFDDKILAIRELRDRIVHRDFMKIVRSDIDSSSLWMDNIVYDKIKVAGFSEDKIKIKTKEWCFIDTLDFINFVENIIVEIVNNILNIISREIYKSEEKYEIWSFLDLPNKPYVL